MLYDFTQEASFKTVDQAGGGQPVVFGPSSKISFSDMMPFVGLGATAFADNGIYLDLYYQMAFSGSDNDTIEKLQPSGNSFFDSTSQLVRTDISRDWDRDEFSLTLGYALTENFALFAGYKRSETNFDEKNRITNVSTSVLESSTSTLDYVQNGPFIGGTYGWRIQRGGWLDGVLALNLGVAFINGEIDQGTAAQKIKGDTIGLTLGFGWTGRLLEGPGLFPNGLNYTLAIDGYQYNFDADEKSKPGEIQGADFSETVLRFSAGISVPFDFSF
jgi:hypothetical protein